MIISERIKKARINASLSQAQVAKALGISQASYQKYEVGRDVKSERIKQLSDILEISPSYLLGVTDDPTPDTPNGFELVPIYGDIAAGTPIESYIQHGEAPVPVDIIKKYPDGFLLKVCGESMNKILPNGCLAFIDPCKTVDHNNKPYAICVNGNTATIKRVRKLANGFELIPDSTDPTYRSKIYDYNDDTGDVITVVGRVVWHAIPFDWDY